MATYVNLDTIHRPSNGAVAPSTWGDQINDNFVALEEQTASPLLGNPAGRIYVSSGIVITGSSAIVQGNYTSSFLQGEITAVTNGDIGLGYPIAGWYHVEWDLHFTCDTANQIVAGNVISTGGMTGAADGTRTIAGGSVSIGRGDTLYVPANGNVYLMAAAAGTGYTWTYDQSHNYLVSYLVSQ